MTGARDGFDEFEIEGRASVSEIRWFFCLHNYLADIGPDQNLADALIESGMRPEDAVCFMRALLRLAAGRSRRPKTRGGA